MRTLEPSDFINALDVLARLGWCKGRAIGDGGSVCAARALNIAAKERSGDWADLDEAMKVLKGLIPDTGTKDMISRWNDASSTQFNNVVRVFQAAAARMEGFGAQDPRDDT